MLKDHTQPNNPEQYSITGMATTLTPVVSSEVHEHYLSRELCQLQIDGRLGSNACTVISCLLAKEVLSVNVDLPTYDHELASHPVANQYVDIIQQGNNLYDLHAVLLDSPFLSTFDALKLYPSLQLTFADKGELCTTSSESCLTKTSQFLTSRRQRYSNTTAAVFIAKGRSVALVVTENATVVIFDSHSHDQKGALIAVSTGIAPAIRFLCNRLYGGIDNRRGPDVCFLEKMQKIVI